MRTEQAIDAATAELRKRLGITNRDRDSRAWCTWLNGGNRKGWHVTVEDLRDGRYATGLVEIE